MEEAFTLESQMFKMTVRADQKITISKITISAETIGQSKTAKAKKTIQRLLEYIAQSGKPDSVISRESGIPQANFNHWRDERNLPSSKMIQKIDAYFNSVPPK